MQKHLLFAHPQKSKKRVLWDNDGRAMRTFKLMGIPIPFFTVPRTTVTKGYMQRPETGMVCMQKRHAARINLVNVRDKRLAAQLLKIQDGLKELN